MNPDAAMTALRDVTARWNVDQANAAAVVLAACDLLVVGEDGPALCALAAVSLIDADVEVQDLLPAALAETGIAYHQKGTPEAEEAGIRAMAARVLSGALTPRAMAAWAHRRFQHDQLDLAEPFLVLDDRYDLDGTSECRAEVDADIVVEARRITGPR